MQRLEWKEQDWRLFKASKGLRNEDSIGKWPLDMVEVPRSGVQRVDGLGFKAQCIFCESRV